MNQPNVNVGILSSTEIHFDLYGEFTTNKTARKISGRFVARCLSNQIIIYRDEQELFSGNEIIFIPKDIETESFLLREVVIGKNFHWQKKEDQRFRGKLKFIIEENVITAINIIPIEEYLTSVISSEMSSNSSLEMLKAHAVVARGWLLAQLAKGKSSSPNVNEIITDDEIVRWYDRDDHSNYDFCADDHCQRYQGITKIVNDKAVNAITQTRGLFLIYNGKICDTRYSKCCGGMSEAFENVWENSHHEYLSPIVDYKFELDGVDNDLKQEKYAERWIYDNPHAYCNTADKNILSQVLVDFDRDTNDFFRWKVEYTQSELSEIIAKKTGIDFGEIEDLIPIERGDSSRIIKLKIVGTKKVLTIGKELEIRKTLSQTHLYSSAFVVRRENIKNHIPAKFVLFGAGWGHGVGLCQIGAAVMGERGYHFDEILMHYFRGASIHKGYS